MTSGAHEHPELARADHVHPAPDPHAHVHAAYAGLDELRSLAGRVAVLEVGNEPGESGDTEPPPDPPSEPPPPPDEDEGVLVPEGAGHAWFLQYPDAPVFRFDRPFSGTVPVIDGATYRGNVEVRSSDEEFSTPSGDLVQGRIAVTPATPSRLTHEGRGPLFVNPAAGRRSDVTIEGFEITGVRTHELQHGVLDLAWIDDAVLRGNWIHDNGGTAVRIGQRCKVRDNLFHGSEHLAIGGLAPDVDVSRNECWGNTTGHTRFNWESGAIKLVLGSGEIHHNYVHDELAHGIWTDIDAYYDVRSNVVLNNRGPGLMIAELTLPGSLIHIEDNVARGNGHTGWANQWSVMRAQLLLAAGAGIRVHGNEFEQTGPGQHGISIVQQFRRHRNRYCYCDDIVVAGNKVTRASGDRNRLGTYDDTCGRTSPSDFVPCYLRNWNRSDVPASRRASLVLGPNELG